jgi:VanZ family protein
LWAYVCPFGLGLMVMIVMMMMVMMAMVVMAMVMKAMVIMAMVMLYQQKIFQSGRKGSVRVDTLRQSCQRHHGGGLLCTLSQ